MFFDERTKLGACFGKTTARKLLMGTLKGAQGSRFILRWLARRRLWRGLFSCRESFACLRPFESRRRLGTLLGLLGGRGRPARTYFSFRRSLRGSGGGPGCWSALCPLFCRFSFGRGRSIRFRGFARRGFLCRGAFDHRLRACRFARQRTILCRRRLRTLTRGGARGRPFNALDVRIAHAKPPTFQRATHYQDRAAVKTAHSLTQLAA